MKKIILPLLISLIATSCGGTSNTSIPIATTITAAPTTIIEKTTTTKTALTDESPTTTVISETPTTASSAPETTEENSTKIEMNEETPSVTTEEHSEPISMVLTPLPETLDFLVPHFSKHLDIWGTKIIATPETPDEKVLHAAIILAEYLDNDEDGIPDDHHVVSALAENKSMITMAATELDFFTSLVCVTKS